MPNELIEAWRRLETGADRTPYILPGDQGLQEFGNGKLVHKYRTYSDYLDDEDHGRQHSGCFHMGLLPVPYAGNLASAKVFLLFANPGFGAHDYFAEYEVPAFREAAIRSLKQKNRNDLYPMIYLDPQFAWHGGGVYWQKKLANILAKMEGTYKSALQILSRSLAVLERVPYHSIDTTHSAGIEKLNPPLLSIKLIKEYLHKTLVPRAQDGEIAIIALRPKLWDIEKFEGKNIIVYKEHEPRSAHLTLVSRGGAKIVEFLKLKLRPD